MTIAEGAYSLSDASMRVAGEGIRGMINATAGATVTSYVMIEAALHILAAWVAASQTKSTAAERRMSRSSRCCYRHSLTVTAPLSGFLIRGGSTMRRRSNGTTDVLDQR